MSSLMVTTLTQKPDNFNMTTKVLYINCTNVGTVGMISEAKMQYPSFNRNSNLEQFL